MKVKEHAACTKAVSSFNLVLKIDLFSSILYIEPVYEIVTGVLLKRM